MVRFPLDFETDDVRVVSTDQIVSRQIARSLRLNENDQLLFAGLFTAYAGKRKNYPIVRHGELALVTEEKIPVKWSPSNAYDEDAFLAEITSFGGNSGSPVFLRISPLREAEGLNLSGYRYLLLGVMQGFFNEIEPMNIQVAQIPALGTQNSGIATVIPGQQILDILNGKRGDGDALWAVGNTFLKDGKFKEAADAYEQALGDLEASLDPNHPLLAQLMLSYAAALERTGEIGKARLLQQRARIISTRNNHQ
jgi:tetratricopeptide (TPR) repeat protein